MRIHYRVLACDDKRGTISVRYHTDALSERALSRTPNDAAERPEACQTDASLTLWKSGMTRDEVHAMIVAQAPAAQLDIIARARQGAHDVSAARSMVGATGSGDVVLRDEVEIPLEP